MDHHNTQASGSGTGSGSKTKQFRVLNGEPRSSSEEVRDGLRRAIADEACEVFARGSKRFTSSATIFNGSIKTSALAVVRPVNAANVSATVRYCRRYGLDMSVKGGGSGVHGQSIAGHVILDMISMNDISLSLPSDDSTLEESFSRLQLESVSRRPSLLSAGSSSSTVTKRSAADADVEDEEAKNKRRDLDDIREDVERDESRGSSTPSSDERPSGSSAASRSNSGSGSDSRGGTNSTPPTSINDSTGAVDVTRAVHAAFSYRNPAATASGASSASGSGSGSGSGFGSGSGSGSSAGSSHSRTTYVNPSPISVGSFPFVPTHGAIGSVPSYASPYETGFGGVPLRLNTHPNPAPYALATFGAGTHSKELDAYTAKSPLGAYHVPTSAFPVGAGQFLSGGFGFIGRKHGLAMDALVEAEVVLADGRIVWVGEDGRAGGEWKEDEDPSELWWGLRGAGATLGVVTRFRTRAFYVPSVFAGNFIYVFDRATAPSLLRHVRDCIKGSSLSLYANIIMTAGPPGAPAIVVIQLCFSGRRQEGEGYVQTIAAWDGGRCLFQDFSERTFERQQVAVEEVLKGGYGKKWYIKSDMLKSLTDEVIDATCARFQNIPDGCTWLFEFTGSGAQGEVKDSCFSQTHREGMFTVAALHQWAHDEPPALDTACVTTAEEWIREVIRPNSPGGPLPCSARETDVRSVYGDNFDRLVALKRKMDPEGFFKHAMFVRPDGSSGPDEWKQLPPLTEERVRGMQRDAKGKRRAEAGPSLSPAQVTRAAEAQGEAREVGAQMLEEAGADGMQVDGEGAGMVAALMQSPAADGASGATVPMGREMVAVPGLGSDAANAVQAQAQTVREQQDGVLLARAGEGAEALPVQAGP